jgi:hypothetical protein
MIRLAIKPQGMYDNQKKKTMSRKLNEKPKFYSLH